MKDQNTREDGWHRDTRFGLPRISQNSNVHVCGMTFPIPSGPAGVNLEDSPGACSARLGIGVGGVDG